MWPSDVKNDKNNKIQMKLIFKTTSGGFSYPVKSKYQELFLNILLFIIFILFIYCCIVQVVDINFFIRLLVVYSFVYIYRLVRYIAVHLILSTIESLPSIEAKRLRLLHLNALYHKLNVYYYL